MSKRTYPVPNKNLSGSDYIQNKRAKQLFSGTSNLAKTIEEQNGNFPLLTPQGKLKPYQGTYGLSGRSTPNEKTYCLNTSHSYRDLLAITKGKYLLTPPNIAFASVIQFKDVSNAQKLYNGLYYSYSYNSTNALAYMDPGYPTTPASYVPNQIEYAPSTDASQRIIVDPSYVITYSSESCVLTPSVTGNVTINNDYDSRYSFNRTINLALLSGFQYPSKFSLDYETGDCINASNDIQGKYAFPSPPVNMIAPVISGNTDVGSTLTCSNGTWNGFPPPTFTYQWYRGTSPISGATTNTYVIQAPTGLPTITCQVTATNASGSATATSNAITPTAPPANIVAPVISGIPPYAVGSTLTCSNGTWNGYLPPTFTYQWFRGASPISPAQTGSSYIIVAADLGFAITCNVTGTNASGSATATSSNPITPTGVPMINTSPVISGNTPVGSILTTTNGTWYTSSVISGYAYQWYRGASPISGATNITYTTQSPTDIGQVITCRVTATNAIGSSSPATSSNSITPTSAPINSSAPVISGNTLVGSTLTLDNPGSWNGSAPITYTYQWYRGASSISGATNITYTTQSPADIGQVITCHVTATNASGSATATSNAITPTAPPANIVAPVISGIPPYAVGSTLTCSNGTWNGYLPPTFTYQWFRGASPISPAQTGSSYIIVAADLGFAITCNVTGTNASGSATATSSNPITPTGVPMINTSPVISGNTPVGSILTTTNGTWYTSSVISGYAYQWYRGASPISGATNITYTTQSPTDIGQVITCRVTATNAIGSSSPATSSNSITPTSAPINSSAPVISGNTLVGSTLTLDNPGSWNGSAPITYTYQWYRGASSISGATNITYTTQSPADIGQVITCHVTATNAYGSSTEPSNPITPTTPPLNTLQPAINGVVISAPPVGLAGIGEVGNEIICNPGTWDGFPALTFTYQWYRGTSTISGATNSVYISQMSDVGDEITCHVTGTNVHGSVTAISNITIPTYTSF